MAPVSLTDSTLALIEGGRAVAASDPSAYERAVEVINSIYPDEFPYYLLGIAKGVELEVKSVYDLGVTVGEFKGALGLIKALATASKQKEVV